MQQRLQRLQTPQSGRREALPRVHRAWIAPLITALTICALALPGCAEEDPLDPPRIHYGEDVCAVCHMIVSDERYAAAISIRDDQGRVHKHIFDDIGCIFEYEQANPDQPIIAYFVRNARSTGWLDATVAEFVHSRDIHTPMAFGLAAFPTLPEARELHREVGGDLITLDEARRRFALNVLHVSTLGEEPQAVEFDSSSTRDIAFDDGRRLRLHLDSPQQLPPGEHPFEITITEIAPDGSERPIDDVTLEIEPLMPSMNHGSPNNVHPEPLGGGRYRGQAHFTMSGEWVVHVTVRPPGLAADAETHQFPRATFSFEVQR